MAVLVAGTKKKSTAYFCDGTAEGHSKRIPTSTQCRRRVPRRARRGHCVGRAGLDRGVAAATGARGLVRTLRVPLPRRTRHPVLPAQAHPRQAVPGRAQRCQSTSRTTASLCASPRLGSPLGPPTAHGPGADRCSSHSYPVPPHPTPPAAARNTVYYVVRPAAHPRAQDAAKSDHIEVYYIATVLYLAHIAVFYGATPVRALKHLFTFAVLGLSGAVFHGRVTLPPEDKQADARAQAVPAPREAPREPQDEPRVRRHLLRLRLRHAQPLAPSTPPPRAGSHHVTRSITCRGQPAVEACVRPREQRRVQDHVERVARHKQRGVGPHRVA